MGLAATFTAPRVYKVRTVRLDGCPSAACFAADAATVTIATKAANRHIGGAANATTDEEGKVFTGYNRKAAHYERAVVALAAVFTAGGAARANEFNAETGDAVYVA